MEKCSDGRKGYPIAAVGAWTENVVLDVMKDPAKPGLLDIEGTRRSTSEKRP